MTSVASSVDLHVDHDIHSPKPKLDHPTDVRSILVFLAIIAIGLSYTAWSIYNDVKDTGAPIKTYLPFALLGVALLIALGFEFVNGFHDTANAVATVIYTHSLPPMSPSSGPASSTSLAFCCRPAPSPSASSRCCLSN